MELFRDPVAITREVKETVRRKIGVVSASTGAGASFVCGQMAYANYSKVNIIEVGKPYFYVALELEKRMETGKVFFYEDELNRDGQKGISNEYMNINWLVRRNASLPLSLDSLQKIVTYPPDGISIFDFSGCPQKNVVLALGCMDEIRIVIDPLPTKLIEAAPFIEEIKLRFPSALILVNKMNKGVHKSELKRFLGNSEFKEIQFYPPEKIYRAEYNCVLPNFFT